MRNKKLWKYFIPLFLIAFIIFNWDNVSHFFNYRYVSSRVSDVFETKEQEAQISHSGNSVRDSDKETDIQYYEKKEGSIEIPKILGPRRISLVFTESSDPADLEKALDLGVVHFPGSALPGQAGQTILLGHSAPPRWPEIKHDWVFSDLNNLVAGEVVYVFFNNKKYEYAVTRKFFLERGEEVPTALTNNKNMLILISCWPPGRNIQRIAVEAAAT